MNGPSWLLFDPGGRRSNGREHTSQALAKPILRGGKRKIKHLPLSVKILQVLSSRRGQVGFSVFRPRYNSMSLIESL